MHGAALDVAHDQGERRFRAVVECGGHRGLHDPIVAIAEGDDDRGLPMLRHAQQELERLATHALIGVREERLR